MSYIKLPVNISGQVVTVPSVATLPPATQVPIGSERVTTDTGTLYISNGTVWNSTGGGGGSGTVTSIDVSGDSTGLTFTGGPVTTAGVITMGGKLAVGFGGTNSAVALNNNRVMQSTGGTIAEAAAITASRALASDANGIPVASATTATELGFVNGVTSAIQTQFSGKVTGPASATDTAIVKYDGTTGKLVKDSVVTIADTTGNVAGVGSLSAVSYSASGNGAASTAIFSETGTIFTGGSGTTTFPYHQHNVTGATAVTTWSTSGTFIGLNSGSGFAGNFIDLHVNGGTSLFKITSAGSPVIAAAGAASTPGISATGTIFTGGSATTTFPYYYHNVGGTAVTTFSTAGTFFGVNAASGFTGNIFDYYVNGATTVARLDYTGTFTVAPGQAAAVSVQPAAIRFNAGATGLLVYNGTGTLGMPTDGTLRIRNDATTANIPITASATAAIFGSGGTYGNLFRFYNSTTAQAMEIYNTRTDASNNEFLTFDWVGAANVLTLKTVANGTGTLRGINFTAGSNVGMKFGTATTDKLAFWNTAPIAQPTTGVAAATFVSNTSLIANDTATFDGYTIGQVVKALRNEGLLA